MRCLRIVLLACVALSAKGAALYQFSGTYTEFFTQVITGPVTFSLSLPAEVATPDRFFPNGQLTCSGCLSVSFINTEEYARVGYQVQSLAEYYFYFDLASLTQTGTYDSQVLEGLNDGVLTTRITRGPGGPEIPEPSTAALMMAGMGLCAVRMWRRLN